jgi:hypothetical protein
MKWHYPLTAALNNLGGCVMFVWARSIKPHKLAWEGIGIRIVSPNIREQSTNSGDSQDVYRALFLLQKYAPEQMDRIKKHIEIIFLRDVGGPPLYIRTGWICHLSLRSFPRSECLEGTRPIAIAGILVNVATWADSKLGPFNFNEQERAAVRNNCQQEQYYIVRKLSGILCEPEE